MELQPHVRNKILRDVVVSLLLYVLPVLLMFAAFAITGQRPWEHRSVAPANPSMLFQVFHGISAYGITIFMVVWGALEFALGLYDEHWTGNERTLDIACFGISLLVIKPLTAYVGLSVLPWLLPGLHNTFSWIPFGWGFLIIAVGDDLAQYWYHRLHHQLPWLWRFHRTHHSAPYMGMAMSGRQNFLYTIFFSQVYLTVTLAYLGLGAAALFALVIKSVIVTLSHSSIPWDKPLYRYRILSPLAWVIERVISTPATHHAHHATTTDDGVGYYKGNFGNMFFLWDVVFGTAWISRKYPEAYGISHYEGDEWYAQLLWPIVKSSVHGSELAAGGPMVRADIVKDE